MRHLLQNVVRHIAQVMAERAGRGMGENHRGLGNLQRRPHRFIGDVRQVHQHAQPIHLAHHLLAKRRQAMMHGRVGGGIGPVVVLHVGQRHVARAQGVGPAQNPQRIPDGMTAFHADQRRDLPLAMNADNVVRRPRQFKVIGIARNHAMNQVDLFQHGHDRVGLVRHVGNVNRPELAAHMPGAQARDVRDQRGEDVRGCRGQDRCRSGRRCIPPEIATADRCVRQSEGLGGGFV